MLLLQTDRHRYRMAKHIVVASIKYYVYTSPKKEL